MAGESMAFLPVGKRAEGTSLQAGYGILFRAYYYNESMIRLLALSTTEVSRLAR